MEKPSPTTSISPSNSGSSNPPVQPTYTTAGTIYNPNSSQPLQPPTRRGRSLKWTSGGAYSDLSLLPRSLLASLQAKSTTAGRRSPYSPAQYTPLQQNYDRAAHPTTTTGRHGGLDDMMPARWTGSPAPETVADDVLSYTVSDRDHDGDDEEDDEDDAIDSIIMNMTVKSLHNLASYPNPNQKRAQKALLRPVKPRLPLQYAGANDMSAQLWDRRESPDLGLDRTWPKPRLSHSDSVASHLMAKDELQSITERVLRERPITPHLGDDSDKNVAWLAQLALGAPRPLTAGPPGQRQYRASTFKSTFKALKTDAKTGKQVKDDEAYAITARVLQHAGIDDARGKLESSLSHHESDSYAQSFQDSQTQQGVSPNIGLGIVGSPDRTNQCDEEAFAAAAVARPEWGMCAPYAERSRRNPEYEASFMAYMEKMDKLWYQGCETLCGDQRDAGGMSVGVIGDGRPGHVNRHCEMTIAEANKMDVADHAKPLLEMAMANLERSLVELLKTQ